MARAYCNEGEIDIAKIIENSEKIILKFEECLNCICIGDILLNMNSPEAEFWIKKALDTNTRNDMKWRLATSHVLYANWYKKRGDNTGAKEQFTKAIDIFKECGADGWVTRTEKSLAELQ